MRGHSSLSLPIALAAGVLICADLARAEQLCGHSFEFLRGLYEEIRASKGGSELHIDRPDVHMIVAEDAIWAFAQNAHPASPAVLCRSLARITGSNEPEIQYRCEGERAGETFATKFSSNDWRATPKK